jgi:ATP-dependent DNA ligase
MARVASGSTSAATPPEHRNAWLPMRPYVGRARPAIRDPIVEPFWSGVRVLAHLGDETASGIERPVRLMAGDVDLASELPEIAALLRDAVDAVEAVVDGVVTRQVGLRGVGAASIVEVRSSATGMLMRNSADIDVRPRGLEVEPNEADEGFVAVDLLSIDGADLLDVPLLERKRLLESVIRESDGVRLSVIARPPIETWVATWKALGLRGGLLKAANSRYQPAGDSVEWRIVERVGRP